MKHVTCRTVKYVFYPFRFASIENTRDWCYSTQHPQKNEKVRSYRLKTAHLKEPTTFTATTRKEKLLMKANKCSHVCVCVCSNNRKIKSSSLETSALSTCKKTRAVQQPSAIFSEGSHSLGEVHNSTVFFHCLSPVCLFTRVIFKHNKFLNLPLSFIPF